MAHLQWISTLDNKCAMQSPSQSRIGSPAFRLDLKNAIEEPAMLNFPNACESNRNQLIPVRYTKLLLPLSTLRFMAITQGLVIVILILLVGGLLYWTSVLNSNIDYYYTASKPYIHEAIQNGISTIEHTANSSAALENVMHDVEVMTNASLPALIDAVNRSVGIVAHMEQLVRNPTLQLSLG